MVVKQTPELWSLSIFPKYIFHLAFPGEAAAEAAVIFVSRQNVPPILLWLAGSANIFSSKLAIDQIPRVWFLGGTACYASFVLAPSEFFW